jgi:adenosylcobinamide-GDP ribazoletransferase
MLLAPAVGAALGAVAGLGGAGLAHLSSHLLGAVAAIVLLAGLTRGLHLDGLADTVDGLASYQPGPEALDIMRSGPVGPLGAASVGAVLLLDVAALASTRHLVATMTIAAAVGRLTVPLSATPRTPSARPEGLGAMVAGSVRDRSAAITAGLVLAGALAVGAIEGGGRHLLTAGLSVPLAVLVAAVVRRHLLRRLGGMTGDTLGASIEFATTTALIVLACGR